MRYIYCLLIAIYVYSPINSFSKNTSLVIKPELIEPGEFVDIKILTSGNDEDYRVSISSPSGNIHMLKPKWNGRYYQLSFNQTLDKGFLKKMWNQCIVSLYDSNNKLIEKSSFYIKEKNKTLYFTVYVDDIGGGGFLDKSSRDWYKKIGGIINYGYQNDDYGRHRTSIKEVSQEYKEKSDYIFLHYHALQFLKNRMFLELNRLLNWKIRKENINNLLGIKLRDRHYLLLISILLLILLFSLLISKKDIYVKLFFIYFIYYYVNCSNL